MQKKIAIISALSILSISSMVNALTIINQNDGTGIYANKPMRVLVGKPLGTADPNTPESCYNQFTSYYSITIEYGKSFNTDDILDSDSYIPPRHLCLQAEFPVDAKPLMTHKSATNMVLNDPKCSITFVKIAGFGEGTAKATEACHYVGKKAP